MHSKRGGVTAVCRHQRHESDYDGWTIGAIYIELETMGWDLPKVSDCTAYTTFGGNRHISRTFAWKVRRGEKVMFDYSVEALARRQREEDERRLAEAETQRAAEEYETTVERIKRTRRFF